MYITFSIFENQKKIVQKTNFSPVYLSGLARTEKTGTLTPKWVTRMRTFYPVSCSVASLLSFGAFGCVLLTGLSEKIFREKLRFGSRINNTGLAKPEIYRAMPMS